MNFRCSYQSIMMYWIIFMRYDDIYKYIDNDDYMKRITHMIYQIQITHTKKTIPYFLVIIVPRIFNF